MPSDPYADLRQMTPEAQRKMGSYVQALLDLEFNLRAVLVEHSARSTAVQQVALKIKNELIRLHAEKYAHLLSGDKRQAKRQIEEMADQDLQAFFRRAAAMAK